MKVPEFEFLEPSSVEEACAMLARDPGQSALFAGGTDMMVDLKLGATRPRRVISLRRIRELDDVVFDPAAGLRIGAMATVNRVSREEAVRRHYPGVVDAARCLAADQVRNLATVAGNLCAAVPSADMAPILLVHGAKLQVVSPDGERVVPLGRFFVGPRETVLGPTDVVVAIDLPAPRPGAGDASLRQGGRVALSLPMASAAALVEMEGDTCGRAAVALGAVAPTPILAPGVGEAVSGRALTDDLLARAGELAASEAKPISDVRSSREYRLELVKVLTRRVLAQAAERAHVA
jgi:carbon-monoxide dehydrogenase medium subunit